MNIAGQNLVLVPALVCAAVGATSGLLVPRVIAQVPEPPVDPRENPEDFPDKVPFGELAGRRSVLIGSVFAGLLVAGSMGAVLGWSWALLWLLYLVPIGCALSATDWVTWFLPKKIIAPTYVVEIVIVLAAAAALHDGKIVFEAAIGWAVLGGYYGILWLISPRIMAFGDVRLGGLLGIALGPFGLGALVTSAFVAALLGVIAMVPMRRRGKAIKRHVPFGPFLFLGAWIAVLVAAIAID